MPYNVVDGSDGTIIATLNSKRAANEAADLLFVLKNPFQASKKQFLKLEIDGVLKINRTFDKDGCRDLSALNIRSGKKWELLVEVDGAATLTVYEGTFTSIREDTTEVQIVKLAGTFEDSIALARERFFELTPWKTEEKLMAVANLMENCDDQLLTIRAVTVDYDFRLEVKNSFPLSFTSTRNDTLNKDTTTEKAAKPMKRGLPEDLPVEHPDLKATRDE